MVGNSRALAENVKVSRCFSGWRIVVLTWLVFAALSCGVSHQPEVTSMRNSLRISENTNRDSSEWQWFVLPAETNDIFRQQGLRMIAAEPLWLRTPDVNALGHLRIIWSGGLIGRVIVETRWNAERVDAERSTLDRSVRKEYLLDEYRAARQVVDFCSKSLISSKVGATIESSPREPVLDGNKLTLEYRVGDAVYGIARANPMMDSRSRGLEDIVKCVCDVIRLPQRNLPAGIEALCADALNRE